MNTRLATEVPLAKWQLAFDTQVRAFFVGARAAAKYMTRGGRILALSYTPGGRTGGWQPWVGMGAAKAALDSTCRYFAVALGRHGITVNAVSPGICDASTVIGQTPQEVQDALKTWVEAGWTPMRRLGTPEDIANVCALLCSEEAGFVTGQTISVDGGQFPDEPGFPVGPTNTYVVDQAVDPAGDCSSGSIGGASCAQMGAAWPNPCEAG